MTLIEALQLTLTKPNTVIGRKSDKYCEYGVNEHNELCLCWDNYDDNNELYYTITRPEYTGFENLDLKDVLATDWIEKGFWIKE